MRKPGAVPLTGGVASGASGKDAPHRSAGFRAGKPLVQTLEVVAQALVVNPDCYIPNTVGIWEQAPEKTAMSLFPNPADSRAEVSLKSQSAFEARLSLHNLGGSVLISQTMHVQPGTNRAYLDLRALPPGHYFVRVEHKGNGRAEVQKLSIIR